MSWLRTPWSIQRVVRRDAADWLKFNEYRQRLRLTKLDEELLFAGENPGRFLFSLVVLYLLTLLLGQVLPADWVAPRWDEWKDAEQLAYFTALWSVQATVVALVYPIVIAFVAVFLQRRPASETFIHLYVLHSGALVAGLSSLGLVLVMAAQYVMVPTHGTDALPVWVALDAFWFLLNAALTTLFLYRTIDFLRPQVQSTVVRRYAANVALPRDVSRLYSFQVLYAAPQRGWIPVPSYLDDKAKEGPKVHLSRHAFRDRSVPQGTRKLRRPSRLHDVRLWPLRLVVSSWARAAKKTPKPAKDGPLSSSGWPLLTIPITPGTIYSNDIDLSRVSDGPPLRRWQLLLVRASLVFRPVDRERYGVTVKAIVEELEADARSAAARSDVAAFERAYEDLVTLHELLLGACLVKQDDGTIGSWALLPEVQSFFERELHAGWVGSYRSVFEAALDSVERESSPVRRMCHLIQHLDGPELQGSPLAVRKHLLEYAPVFMYELGNWWTRRVEEQGVLDHGPHRMVTLRAPQSRVYDEVVSTFVSGWENGRTTLVRIPERTKEFSWSSAADLGDLSATHIQETARMLLSAVARGDRAAAEWLADVMAKWWGSLEFEHDPIALYGKTAFITLENLKQSWHETMLELALTDDELRWGGGGPRALERGVLLAAVRNFWNDVRWLTVEILVNWSLVHSGDDLSSSLALEIAGGLLRGRQWRDGGNTFEPLSEASASDYLSIKARQYAASGEYRGGYIGRLDSFVGRIKDMRRPSMVSSRVYTFGGADDVASLQESQFILLAVLSTADWSVGDALRRQVDVWLAQKYESFDVLRQRVADWCRRLDMAEQPLDKRVVDALLARTSKAHNAETGQARTRQGVASLQSHLELVRGNLLDAEPVDPARLVQLGEFASESAFSAKAGSFPLQLFASIATTEESLEDFALTMRQVRKGELTRLEIDQRASNEKEFWAETMERQVGAVVMSDVIRSCEVREVHAPDAASYWVAVKDEAARLEAQGLQPLLLLDNATRPNWVWQWQHADERQGYQRPPDLRVQRREGRGPSYVCDFNGVPVYAGLLPPGQSLVISKEAFKSLAFRAYAPERFVEVTTADRTDSKHLVDVVLRFSRRVTVGKSVAARLLYAGLKTTT